jgi:3',5'-nucleoside bisphosphate phosphatase
MTGAAHPGTALVSSPVDLHLHSCASDGELDNERLIDACVRHGLRVVARVDHNTLRGAGTFAAAARARGIEVIDGCEVSVRWRSGEWHLLAYHVQPNDAVFAGRVAAVAEQERARFSLWLEHFEAAGIHVDRTPVTTLLTRTYTPYFGRFLEAVVPSLTRYPAFAGYADRPYAELVRDWFAEGRPFHVPEPAYPEMLDALDWIADAGGVAVLAHPGRGFSTDGADDALTPLVEHGLAGVEAWTTWHDGTTAAALAEVARRLGLVATIGSDFHGPVKPRAPAPGSLPAVTADPYEIVGRLRERARPRVGEDGGHHGYSCR